MALDLKNSTGNTTSRGTPPLDDALQQTLLRLTAEAERDHWIEFGTSLMSRKKQLGLCMRNYKALSEKLLAQESSRDEGCHMYQASLTETARAFVAQVKHYMNGRSRLITVAAEWDASVETCIALQDLWNQKTLGLDSLPEAQSIRSVFDPVIELGKSTPETNTSTKEARSPSAQTSSVRQD